MDTFTSWKVRHPLWIIFIKSSCGCPTGVPHVGKRGSKEHSPSSTSYELTHETISNNRVNDDRVLPKSRDHMKTNDMRKSKDPSMSEPVLGLAPKTEIDSLWKEMMWVFVSFLEAKCCAWMKPVLCFTGKIRGSELFCGSIILWTIRNIGLCFSLYINTKFFQGPEDDLCSQEIFGCSSTLTWVSKFAGEWTMSFFPGCLLSPAHLDCVDYTNTGSRYMWNNCYPCSSDDFGKCEVVEDLIFHVNKFSNKSWRLFTNLNWKNTKQSRVQKDRH